MDTLDFIMRFEGEADLTIEEVINGFSELIKSGAIRSLQGSYYRYAIDLVNGGYLDSEGNVLYIPDDEF